MTGGSAEKLREYLEAVEAAGGEPLPLVPGRPLPPLETLDGLVLSGGPDVDPAHYGEALEEGMGVEVDPARDALELPLARTAVGTDLPVLGICRGLQVLNVALGGTLFQDLDLQRTGLQRWSHHQRRSRPEAPPDAALHDVVVQPGSLLHAVLGVERLGVNTFHHQAVKKVAPVLVATAWWEDLVEGVEALGRRFVLGVQWHPERMWRSEPACQRLFRALVDAAVRRTRG